MAKFKLDCLDALKPEKRKTFLYDNATSELLNEDGTLFDFGVIVVDLKQYKDVATPSKDNPVGKSRRIKRLKIQLGLSCNYECSYCNQRFVPRADETNPDDIEPFLKQLPVWFDGGEDGDGNGVRIEFWGGEPFVYWKTFKPLATRIREMYPKAEFLVITNGSLLDLEKNQWVDDLGFMVGISHDGPGYHVRGEDPFDNPKQFAAIKDLFDRLNPKNRISFNATLNKDNQSRTAIGEFFEQRLGIMPVIGEGSFVDPYDEGGAASCFDDPADFLSYRNKYLAELRDGGAKNFSVLTEKISDFTDSLLNNRPASALGQKCSMDKKEHIAVDLHGNVLTCQNVSTVTTSANGESHKIGHVSDYNNIKLNTVTHWSHRKECPNCPVLQICQGSCMFLQDKLWELGCDTAFSDNIPIFAASIEAMTGYVPYYIDGPQRDDRKDIFGLVHGIPERKAKKPFPIPVVSA